MCGGQKYNNMRKNRQPFYSHVIDSKTPLSQLQLNYQILDIFRPKRVTKPNSPNNRNTAHCNAAHFFFLGISALPCCDRKYAFDCSKLSRSSKILASTCCDLTISA